MSLYQRPLRSDELMHWGNHKYIAKIGNRYFYTPEELKAFKQGAKGVGQRVSDNFDKLRQHAYDAAGGAAKRRAQQSAYIANEQNKAYKENPSLLLNPNRRRINTLTKKVAADDKAAYDKTLMGRAEAAKKNVASSVESAKKNVASSVESTKKNVASSVESSINHVKNTAAHKLESGKKKVDDYITKRQHDRIKIKAHEAEINPSGSTKEKNPFQEAYDRDQREKKRKKSTLRVAHHITVK